ncbi:MAG: GIY-YIG nuclease family protein [Thermodesulfobacteriota bacterium]
MKDKIQMKNILKIENEKDYKIHLATWNGSQQPLDVFVKGEKDSRELNRWVNGKKHKLNRKYVLLLLNFYPERNIWLFGGIYEVGKYEVRKHPFVHLLYDTEITKEFEPFIGRLKIHFERGARRATYVNLGTYSDEFVVSEILKERYTGEKFPGYENISINFSYLKSIIKTDKPDWKAALENVKGVYLITDKKNGKKYVGSAYGEHGIWARWSCYAGTAHGYNDDLTRLIKQRGEQYALENFTFSLLEYRPKKTDDKDIIQRESFWKEALLSRGEFGYNKN